MLSVILREAMFVSVIYFCSVLSVISAVDTIECASDYKNINDNKTINITEICTESSPCIAKCCPAAQILYLNETDLICYDSKNLSLTYNLSKLDDYSDVEFYENNVRQKIIKSRKKLAQFIQIYNEDFINPDCSIDNREVNPSSEEYLLADGSSALRAPNYWTQWIPTPSLKLCVDHQINVYDGIVSQPELVIRKLLDVGEVEDESAKHKGLAIGMLVSCVFLLLVLGVYCVLPQLRNLAGMILMAYVATLIVMFIFRAAQILAPMAESLPKPTCIWFGLVVVYTVVACFTWMNVLSFDIWWSMRSIRKVRQMHRHGVLVKFCWYSLYGWGAPLLVIIFIVVVEELDLTNFPNFIKPHYLSENTCFIPDEEQLFYVDGPILVTVCINIMLFLMTVYNIWRIKRGVSQHSAGDSKINKKDVNRFSLYFKLSLVMGINWILEILSAIYDSASSWWWFVPDICNTLTGLFIFILFICKKSVIKLLCKRFSIENDYIRRWIHAEFKYADSSRTKNRSSSSRQAPYSMTDSTIVCGIENK